MALTTELLRANATLSALSDEQVAAIVEMSTNDESAVIGQKTGEIYGGLDADILSASGIGKNGTEKTYDYAKRVIGEIKAKADSVASLEAQVADLNKEKTRLEGVIAKGGADVETKRALDKAKADLANVTAQYTDLKTKYDASEEAHAKAMLSVKMDGEFANIGAGLKFKKDIPQAVADMALQGAIARVKAMNPEYIDDGKGGKVLAFMENGTPMRNPEKNLSPYTAVELVERELKAMSILETGRTVTGTGSQQMQNTDKSLTADLSSARTQVEAHDIIRRSLQSQGLAVGNPKFQQEFDKVWAENKETIKSLPLQ